MLVGEVPSNATSRTCAALARRLMRASAACTRDSEADVVGVVAAVEEVVRTEVVAVDDAPVVGVETGPPQPAASAATRTSGKSTMSAAYLTGRGYSEN